MKNTTKLIVRLALLAALSIILGKFLSIKIGQSIRISFENTPLILAGYAFGPVYGAVCAVVADLLGCFLYGYAINPIITIGAAAIGFFSGVFGMHGWFKKPILPLSIGYSHLVGSVVVKSLGLYAFYGTPLNVLVWRLPIYIITAVAEYLIITVLLRNKGTRSIFEK